MASIPLTLAALATSAVPGLVVHGARVHTEDGDGDFTAAVLVSDDEELIIKVPNNSAAEVRQSAELLGLAALTEGARSELPFAVPETRGITRSGDTRAVVATFVPGGHIDAADLEADALLLQPVAEMLAAVHELPNRIVQQAGLTVRTSDECREQAARIVERAVATRLLPETIHHRWERTLGSQELWDFAPTVVHGSLDADRLLIEDDRVAGVLGWSELSVGDPALDFSWVLAASEDVLDSVLARYTLQRDVGSRNRLRARIVFYHELEIARWLLNGVDTRNREITDDAVRMLDLLVDRLSTSSSLFAHRTELSEDQVEQLLEETPTVSGGLSDTAAYEALDEDRMFHADTDFIDVREDLADAERAEAAAPNGAEEREDAAFSGLDSAGDDEHPTEPVDPLEFDDRGGSDERADDRGGDDRDGDASSPR